MDSLEMDIKDDSDRADSETSSNPSLQLQIASTYSLAGRENNLSSCLAMVVKDDPVTECVGDINPRLESAGYSRHDAVIKWSLGLGTDIKEDLDESDTELSIELNPHLKIAHFYPNECENNINPKDPLGTDIEDHQESSTFSCDHCNYKTLDSAKLAQYSQKHTKKIFHCTKCPFQTSYRKPLERHMSKPCDKQRRYPCDQCGYQTNNSSYLKMHRRMHAGDKTYCCTVCTYKTCFSNDLKVHMRKHTGERPYGCNRCDYRAVVIGALKNHVDKVHSEKSSEEVERPFWCTVCPLKFARNSVLRKHMMIHTGERPFSCNVCFGSFSQRGTLVRHLRTHSGGKPFKCGRCELRTACRTTLTKHELRVHPTVSTVEGRLSVLIGPDADVGSDGQT